MAKAREIVALCDRNGWKVIVGVEADKPEDIWNVAELLRGALPSSQSVGAGRNDPCPCGSGLKYKKCCGKR